MNVKHWWTGGRRVLLGAALLLPVLGGGVASAATVGGAQDPASITAFWTVDAAGNVQGNGGAGGFGGEGGKTLTKPIVGMAATATGNGYWLVGGDGGVFSFGDAVYYGGLGNQKITGSITGIASTPDGKGYWLVGSDGKVYPFGDAADEGGYTGPSLFQPMDGIARTPDGTGYVTVAGDGGVFAYHAGFYGSSSDAISGTAVGIAETPDGAGYWIATSTGAIYPHGDAATTIGPVSGATFPAPIVAIVGTGAQGFRLIDADGDAYPYGQTTPNAPAPPTPTTTTPTTTTPTATTPASSTPTPTTTTGGTTTTPTPEPGATGKKPGTHGTHGASHSKTLDVRITFYWKYLNADSHAASVRVGPMPKGTRLTLACTGEDCPAKHPARSAKGRKAVRALLLGIRGQHFLAGQRLNITLSVRGMKPERIGVDFRYGKVPSEAFLKH